MASLAPCLQNATGFKARMDSLDLPVGLICSLKSADEFAARAKAPTAVFALWEMFP
jgi:hypothetical protein